jgi:hypothetical protein
MRSSVCRYSNRSLAWVYMVVNPSMINFGFDRSVRLGPYCHNFAEGTFE